MAKEKNKKEKKAVERKSLAAYFNQKTFLGITLVSVLLLVIIYVFVYLDYTQKTQELEEANTALKATVRELEEYNNNLPQYEMEIEEMKSEAEAILAQYPADAREEDAIMLAVDVQKDNLIDFDAINMEEKEGVYTIAPELVTAAAIEGLDESLVFTKKHAVYVNQTTYPYLKSVIEQIYESDNRIGIDNIVYTKNEEYGILEGNIDIYFYSLAGTDKEYTAPDMAQYEAGTQDLFRSEETVKKMVTENVSDENGAEENAAE